ncbi:MAG: T9SS type A sorting domain-containing protein [bacterium]|nr:T9SS type A sorting domain-containing protein [bacterium]
MFLFILLLATDTLKYDNAKIDGFHIVGTYNDDKIAVKFSPPYAPSKITGILVLTDHPGGFKHASLCYESNGLPYTIQPLTEIDTVYSSTGEWKFTPIEANISDTIPVWFVLNIAGYPGIGGDTISPTEKSYYYSNNQGWKQTNKYNWTIRLIVQDYKGYYEDFLSDSGGYQGNWAFINPQFILHPLNNCFGTQVDSLYPDNARLTLFSPWLKIKNYNFSNPTLVIRHFYNTEYLCDGGNIKISRDSINWQLVSPLSGYDASIIMDPPMGIIQEPVFTGNSEQWENAYFYLPQWDSVLIKYYFISDGIGNKTGWFIDNVGIIEKPCNDVSPISINLQTIIPPNTQIIPIVNIKNYGIYEENNFLIKCIAESTGIIVYQDEKNLSLIKPDSIMQINFSPLFIGNKGTSYKLQVYTELLSDGNKINDTLKQNLLSFPIITSLISGISASLPIIDGIIDSAEWGNATIIDGSDISGIDTKDSINTCKLYFMNNTEALFVGIQSSRINKAGIYIDDNGNGKWDPNEGYYLFTQNTNKFYDYYSNVYTVPDSLVAIGNEGLEVKLPRGNKPYELTMTNDSIGCFIYTQTDNNYTSWWHQLVPYTDYNNPIHYAKIKISGLGIQEKNPPANYFKISTNSPVSTRFINLQISFPITGIRGKLEIYDLTGRIMQSSSFDITNSDFILTRDISKFKTGIYFISCEVPKYSKILKKVIILH